MAHNPYQQAQYYQPQNIYQQLGAPQPHQQGGSHIQQRLALVHAQHQQQAPALVPQRPQNLQQQVTQGNHLSQQQAAHTQQAIHTGQLPIQQRPPTTHSNQQLVHYPTPPPQQVQRPTVQLSYPNHVQQTHFLPWAGPQQPGAAPGPTQSQRRPLPQPRPESTSPTRSRPLPAPTPGPSSENFKPNILVNTKSASGQWSQSSSPTKPSSSTVELPKRGRMSPPKFSVASISPSSLGSSIHSSPSPPSSVSSLSADSFSGSPVRSSAVRGSPIRAAASINSAESKADQRANTSTFTSSASLSKVKSELAGTEFATVPKALPVWKRTLPDVLPPLLPTPPPNPAEQQVQLQRQQVQSQPQPRPLVQQQPSQRSQPPQFNPSSQHSVQSRQSDHTQHVQSAPPPPPIPSHSKPKSKPPLPVVQPQWSHRNNQPVSEEEEDESEEGEEDEQEEEDDEQEEEDEETTEYSESEAEFASSTDQVLPSPQYGIRDLPLRNSTTTAFTHPGPMPQPPAMVRGNGPRAMTSSFSSASAPGPSSDFRTGWTKQDRTRQSMTMRLATSDSDSSSGSAIGLPRPPMMGMGGSNQSTPTERNYDLNLDDTPPPRSSFISQRRTQASHPSTQPSASNVPQTPRKRTLPTPGGQSQTTPTQSSQRRPQSQIYTSTTPRQQPPAMSTRPQSQMYHSPLKQEDGSGTTSHTLQRSRSFGRGRELPQAPGKDQQQPPRAPQPRPQQLQQFQRPQRSQSQPRSHQDPSPTIPSISIESPAPRGGRDRQADIERMESESEGESDRGYGQKHVVHSPVPVPLINIHPDGEEDVDEGPRINVRGPGVPQINVQPAPQARVREAPQIDIQGVPQINIHDLPEINVSGVPQINVSDVMEKPLQGQGSNVMVYEVPGVSVSGPGGGGESMHRGSVSGSNPGSQIVPRRGGLRCGGCGEGIVGRIVNAMGQRWHPACFRCTVCSELLEHVSSYEWEGKAYCHLDYHENFAPKCYSCKTPIYEERFISLDDPALGKRAYHEQHFFCAECGDPFLAPTIDHPSSRTGELTVSGDGEFASDDVGFTVYRGHPYCEACHVRLRLPKCKRCKRSIRDRDQAVEALGGKWCWSCFVCKGCQRPFEDPSFFERAGEPYCENCFSIILRNEL